ncbi:MAG: hypothetical protein ACLT5P_06485 [Flavonifractor plautii]
MVVAFEGEKNGRRLKELLESSGTAACLLCRSADQVKRLVRQQRLTAVVCGYKFPDGTAEELTGELPGFCTVLLAPAACWSWCRKRLDSSASRPRRRAKGCSPRWTASALAGQRGPPACSADAVKKHRRWNGPGMTVK